MAYEEKLDEILSHADCIEKMQLLDYLSNPDGICYGFAMAAAEALLLTFSDLDSEASDAWNRFHQRLALIHAIPKEEFKKKLVYGNLRVDPGKGKILQKETLYVHITAEGNLAYRTLNAAGEEVSGLIHVGMENGKYIYRPLDPPGHFPRGVLAPGFNLEVLEEHQHLNAILKITTERGHTRKELALSSLTPEVLALLKAHPLMQSVPPENWSADTVSIPPETWNAIRPEIHAFFDKIDLLFQADQYAKKYPSLFPQEATPKTQGLGAASLVRSAITEEQEGQLTCADSFTAIYTPYALAVCFASLAKEAEKTQESVVLTLSNLGHRITVAYDCKEKRWLLSEAEKSAGRSMQGEKEIAEEVFSSFFPHEMKILRLRKEECFAVLQISVMTLGEKELSAAAKAWKENLHTIGLLTVTREKAAFVDIRKVSWLYLAAQNGETATVHTLLEKGADPNQAEQEDGITPLYIAVQNGHAAVVQALLEGRADPNQVRNDGVTPLYIAAQKGHIAVVRTLLKGRADPNQAKDGGDTPLYIAAQNGHAEAVQALLKGGALPNQAGSITPLYVAAQQGYAAVVQVLLEGKADPNQARNDGATPLYIAAQNGHAAAVQALLKGEAHPNQACHDGITPLCIAAQKGHTAAVQALLEGKANPNQARNDGATPLFMAAGNGHAAAVQALLKGGALPNQARKDGMTPLIIAAVKGQVTIVQALLKGGALPNQARKDGMTPLRIAEWRGDKKMLELFRTFACIAELNSYIKEKEEIHRSSRFALLSAAIPTKEYEAAKALLFFVTGKKGHLEPATVAALQADEQLGKIYQSAYALFPVLQTAEGVDAKASVDHALGWGGLG